MCLNITYKMLTGALTQMLMEHVMTRKLLPPEQKALRSGCRRCLDALIEDAMLAREAQASERDLSVAWIDYRKAYDMVPHRWIRDTLRAVRMQ